MRWFALACAFGLMACKQQRTEAPPPPDLSPARLQEIVAASQRDFVDVGDSFSALGDRHTLEVAKTGAARMNGLRLETKSIRRQGWTDSGVKSAARAGTGEVVLSREGSVERWINRRASAEQSWRFAAPPEGKGDLTVEVELGDLPLARAAAQALHFRDPKSGAAVRYGDVAWVDAGGRRTELALQWSGSRARIVVPDALLAASSYPAVLDPTLFPENETDSPIVGPANGLQAVPRMASSPNEYLVVWEDRRHGFTTRVYGELYSRFGQPSSTSVALPIAAEPRVGANSPAVAFNGAHFLVVWIDDADHLRGAFVELNRAISAPFFIFQGASRASEPSVAGDVDTGQFFVAWSDDRNGPINIFGTRVTGAGTVQDGTGIRLSPATSFAGRSSSTYDGTNFVVGWEDSRNGSFSQVYLGRVDPATGGRLDGDGVRADTTTFSQTLPSLAAAVGTQQTLAVWEESRDGGAGDLFGRFFQAGVPQAPAPFTVNASAGRQSWPSLAYDGTRYWLAYETTAAGPQDINVEQIQTNGTILNLNTPVPTDGGTMFKPAVGARANDANVVFGDSDVDGRGDLFGVRCTPSFGTNISCLLPGVQLISQGANGQFRPAAAWDGTQYLVAWSDGRANPSDWLEIYGVLVDPQGVPKNPPAFRIGGGQFEQGYVEVTRGPGQFLVSWGDPQLNYGRYNLVGARVAPNGAVLDSPPLLIADAGAQFAMNHAAVFDGDRYLLVYPTALDRLRLAAVAADGGVLTPPAGIPILPDGGSDPQLAADGTQAMLAFGRGSAGNRQVLVARIQRDGGVAESDGVALTSGATDRRTPGIAFDGQRYLVSWSEVRPTTAYDVMGSYLTPTATAGAPFPISATGEFEVSSGVGYDGERFVLLWNEVSADGGTRMKLGWLSDGGTTLGAQAVVTADFTPNNGGLELAAANSGRTLVPYQRMIVSPGYNAERVVLRVADSRDPLGSGCSDDAQCRSGFCVDGVCCESACGGDDPGDCQACNASGVCQVRAASDVCRASAGGCDIEERCDGVATACPADAKADAGVECRASRAPCDAPETCDGVSDACPNDALRPATFECRPATGGCDLPELCDGQSESCPGDAIAAADVECRQAVSSCDVAETCSGGSKSCPDDLFVSDGTTCDNNGTCQAGVCNPELNSYYGWHCGGCSGAGGLPAAFAALLLAARRRRQRGAGRGPTSTGRRAIAPLLAIVLLAATPARAAEKSELSKLLVLGFTARAGVTEAQAANVASFVQSEMATFNAYRVTGQSELAAVIGLERQKQLLGCAEDGATCMAEVAGAMDADRVITGDLGVLGNELVLNITMVDARSSKPIHRVALRSAGTRSLDALLDQIRPGLNEIVEHDTTRKNPAATRYVRNFGGIVASVRGEADVVRLSPTPAISVELSTRQFGAAITVLVQPVVGVRAEGRFYPLILGGVRPYVGVGATAFAPAVGGRVVAGAAMRVAQLQLSADVAYEQFFNAAPGYYNNAALVGLGAGWQF